MAGVSEQNISDHKLLAATGKPRDEWYGLLDAENASTWKHTKIATWLREAHGVDGWWAQGITVAYEQARGMRLPGQLADGTFTTSASKTLDRPLGEALDLVIDAYSAVSGSSPTSVSRESKHPSARWKLADGTDVLGSASPGTGDKSRVTLTHLKLGDNEQLAGAKAELAKVLSELASRANRSVD